MTFGSCQRKMVPKGPDGVLRVLVIGRVSTPRQDAGNIEAGYRYAEPVIKGVYDGPADVRYLGEQGSGLVVERATIMEAYGLIEAGWPDLVLMEDVSKSYRNPRWIFAFVQDCVDADVRVVAPGDGLDTWDDNWEVVLGAAALRHGLHIPDTRRRVRRTATRSFHEGGMVLRLRFGYRRLSSEEAASGRFGPKGLRLAKVDEWTPLILALREQVVRDRRYGAALADWLNGQRGADGERVPTGPYAHRTEWDWDLVRDLLRDPILCGWRQLRKVRYQTKFKSGKARRVKNPTPDREFCPTVAHMSEPQWQELQQALDELGARYKPDADDNGRRHPRHQVPRRKSISPLQHAACVACGDFYYTCGNGVIKCQNASRRGRVRCWNHVQVSCELARERLTDAALNRLSRHPEALRVLLDAAWQQAEQVRGRAGQAARDLVQFQRGYQPTGGW